MNRTELIFKRPYKESVHRFRKGPGGVELVYITARDVMDKLDEGAGSDGWETKYIEVMGRVICELTVNYQGKLITKSDGAEDTTIEGAKGGLSDALKRAAVQHGIFRYGYIPSAFKGRTPAWWATPEGYDEIMAKKHNKEIEQFRKELGNV